MSKLNNSYWLETDDFFKSASTITEKLREEHCQLCFLILIHHWELLIRLYQDRKVFHNKLLSVENQHKCIQLSTLNYRGSFLENTGKNQPFLMKKHRSFKVQRFHQKLFTL